MKKKTAPPPQTFGKKIRKVQIQGCINPRVPPREKKKERMFFGGGGFVWGCLTKWKKKERAGPGEHECF